MVSEILQEHSLLPTDNEFRKYFNNILRNGFLFYWNFLKEGRVEEILELVVVTYAWTIFSSIV